MILMKWRNRFEGVFFLQCLQTEGCESLVVDCLLVIWSLREEYSRIMKSRISIAKKFQGEKRQQQKAMGACIFGESGFSIALITEIVVQRVSIHRLVI